MTSRNKPPMEKPLSVWGYYPGAIPADFLAATNKRKGKEINKGGNPIKDYMVVGILGLALFVLLFILPGYIAGKF